MRSTSPTALAALAALGLVLSAPFAPAQEPPPVRLRTELRGFADQQGHPAMHLAYPSLFAEGLAETPPAGLTWQHQFTQVIYAPFLRDSGVRLMGAAAMAAELAENPGRGSALISTQLELVERFVASHADRFVLARSPEEARDAIEHTNKLVLVHQIEGGRRVLLGPRDAWYWRSRGVMLVTVMHLMHDELGEAAANIGASGALVSGFLNGPRCASEGRGLTPRGREAIVALDRAGIVVDLSHMSPASFDDALAVCRAHHIAPVVTHGMYGAIQRSERGLSAAQIVELYRLGGMLSLPVDGNALDPHEATVPVPPNLARGTMDSFRFHLETVHRLLRDNATAIVGRPWEQLSDRERTRLAVGWSSDWNGWTVHSRPTPARSVRGPVLDVDRVGLAHPGLLPQYWQRLREDGADLDPVERSLERFVQLWERARSHARRPR